MFVEAELPYEQACTRLDLTSSVADTYPALARAEARAALADLHRLPSPEADRAAGLLRRLGDRSRPWPRGSGELTRRETEVLDLLAEGCSNDGAQRLFISPRTAEHHVTNILSRLGLRNRAEAAAHLVRERSSP